MTNVDTTREEPVQKLRSLFDLTGQVAVITGGSRGLGLQMAEALGEFGARTVLVARKEEQLKEAASALEELGVEADIRVCDMTKPGFAQPLVDSILHRHGKIDILVNNAGTSWGAPAASYPAQGWQKVINLNVNALFELTQYVASQVFIGQRKGSIINMASMEAFRGHPASRIGTVAYNTSKGAVVSMTTALAAEWGQYGIRINAIAPGHFPSSMTKGLLETHGDEILNEIPLRKFGNASDLKGATLLLASDAGGHISGQTIIVDGGASAM